jgi:hypothetical protein
MFNNIILIIIDLEILTCFINNIFYLLKYKQKFNWIQIQTAIRKKKRNILYNLNICLCTTVLKRSVEEKKPLFKRILRTIPYSPHKFSLSCINY